MPSFIVQRVQKTEYCDRVLYIAVDVTSFTFGVQ